MVTKTIPAANHEVAHATTAVVNAARVLSTHPKPQLEYDDDVYEVLFNSFQHYFRAVNNVTALDILLAELNTELSTYTALDKRGPRDKQPYVQDMNRFY